LTGDGRDGTAGNVVVGLALSFNPNPAA